MTLTDLWRLFLLFSPFLQGTPPPWNIGIRVNGCGILLNRWLLASLFVLLPLIRGGGLARGFTRGARSCLGEKTCLSDEDWNAFNMQISSFPSFVHIYLSPRLSFGLFSLVYFSLKFRGQLTNSKNNLLRETMCVLHTLFISSLLASSASRYSMTFTFSSFESVVEGTSSSFDLIRVKTSGNAVFDAPSLLFPYSFPWESDIINNF